MISDRIARHLRFLVEEVGPRPPGSPANRRATEHVRGVLSGAGFSVRESGFTTRWWEPGTGRIEIRDDMGMVERLDVTPNPYSPSCDVTGVLRRVSLLSGLAVGSIGPDDILVLEGELVREQIIPIAYPFHGSDAHTELLNVILAARPAAVVAVSDHWAPIFEDGGLPFPSTSVPTVLGGRLANGAEARLVLGGAVHDADGVNLSALRCGGGDRIVLSAHLDSKVTTPGAFDNAASVALLLAAVETGMLTESIAIPPIELVFFNGEDHFDACGEIAWLADTDLAEIKANVNLDGAGVSGRPTQVSLLSCPPEVERAIVAFTAAHPGWEIAEPWYESDHSIFAMRGIPALAITSRHIHELLASLAHTERDTLDVVDVAVLTLIADDLPILLTDLWRSLARSVRHART